MILMVTLVRQRLIIGLIVALLFGLLPIPVSASIGACSTSISPSSMMPGSDNTLSVRVTNITGPSMVWIQLVRPNADYSITSADAPNWHADTTSSSAVFTGGLINGDGSVTIQLGVHALAWESATANWIVRASDSPFGASATDCSGSQATTIQVYMAPDNAGAGISNVSVEMNARTATIRWISSVPTGSAVSYGSTSDYGSNTAYDATLKTEHHITLMELTPEATYHFQVAGLDDGNAPFFSGDNTFLTLVLPIGSGSSVSSTKTHPAGQSFAPRGTIQINAKPSETVAPSVAVITNLIRPFTTNLSVAGVAGDNVAVARIDYSLDGGKSWVFVPSPPNLGNKQVSFTFAPLADDGNYILVVRATDTSGNTASTQPATFVIDNLAPRIGAELVSFGPQITTPDISGNWQAVPGENLTITMNTVGGPINLVVDATRDDATHAAQSFYLRRDVKNNLWTGVMAFQMPGTYHLVASALDGAGNRVVRALSNVVVAPSARVIGRLGSPVKDAIVTLYWRQPGANSWLKWDGSPYGELNPQQTHSDGNVAFMVPKGTYYIQSDAPGYQTVKTHAFTLDRSTALDQALHMSANPTVRIAGHKVTIPWPFVTLESMELTPRPIKPVGMSQIGHTFPAFRLPATNGGTINLIDLQGKPTILTVLATWAPPTAEQLPALAALHTRPEIGVWPLYLGEHIGRVQTSIARAGLNLPAIVDPSISLGQSLGIPCLPTHYVLDRRGKVVKLVTGVLSESQLLELTTGL